MKRARGNRMWRGMVLTAAIGAIAVLALSGLAAARGHHGGDRHRHGQDTGTISSFDASSGTLAIALSGGDTVTGLVSGRTRIKCEDEHSPDVSTRSRENEPGDDHGGHGEEPGDDNGGHGNEPGDDNGGGSGPSQSGPSGHDDNGVGANCTVSDLIVGATVHEAELDLRNGKAAWDEIELAQNPS